MFPIIASIDDILHAIEADPQFRVAKQSNDTSIICYMLQDEETFVGQNANFKRECRGITFGDDGKILSRTLHKFFNVGESEDTRPDNIPWENITRVTSKEDGSMITFVLLPDGEVVGKTKKTFESREAIAATEFLKAHPEKYEWVKNRLQQNITPIFEWTSSRFPIVLQYKEDQLTLLQIRGNLTGEYATAEQFEVMRESGTPFPIVENQLAKFTASGNLREALLSAAQTETGIEGWVIQDDVGNIWKIKTEWYMKLHRSVVLTRWRDIARTVLDDQSDDLKSAFALAGRDIAPVVLVENSIFSTIKGKQNACQKAVLGWEKSTQKQFALAHSSEPDFSLLMRTFNKQEINWIEWYKKYHLSSWSLDVVI